MIWYDASSCLMVLAAAASSSAPEESWAYYGSVVWHKPNNWTMSHEFIITYLDVIFSFSERGKGRTTCIHLFRQRLKRPLEQEASRGWYASSTPDFGRVPTKFSNAVKTQWFLFISSKTPLLKRRFFSGHTTKGYEIFRTRKQLHHLFTRTSVERIHAQRSLRCAWMLF